MIVRAHGWWCKMRRWNGEKLTKRRLSFRQTKTQLADRMNCLDPGARVSRVHVLKWERGAIPNANYLMLMAEALGWAPERFFDLVDLPTLVAQDPERFLAAHEGMAKGGRKGQRTLASSQGLPAANRPQYG